MLSVAGLEVFCYYFQVFLLVQRLEGGCGQKAAIVCGRCDSCVQGVQGEAGWDCLQLPAKKGKCCEFGFQGLEVTL